MFKSCILAILVLSVLTHKLTPGTKLPHAFDDMIHNNLGATPEFNGEDTAVHTVSKEITVINTPQIQDHIATEIPWINLKSAVNIAFSAIKLREERVESHYVFQSAPEISAFRYALINLAKTKNGLKIVISHETKTAFGVQKKTIYHDVKSSPFGLPFDLEEVLTNTNNDNKEFHEFNRNRLMAGLKAIRGTQNADLLSFDIGAVIQGATGAITSLTDAWKGIATAFKTVKSQTLKEKINGDGYRRYKAASRYIRSIGIPNDKMNIYKPHFITLTKADRNPIVKNEFQTILELAEFLPENAWNANDFTFDINGGGSCNSAVALTRNDIFDGRSHIIAVIVEGTFDLAPHVFIYENFKSVAGGIVESTKTVTKSVPRSLTNEDVKAINAMILLTALEIMSQNFGVPFKLPESAF